MMFDIIFFKLLSLCLFASTAAQNSNHKFLGCFLGDGLLSFGDENYILTSASPQSCSELCVGKQYNFFNIKNDVCYCSKNYISRLMKQFDSDCTLKCAGDTIATCGGPPNYVSSYLTDGSKFGNFQKHGGYPIPIYLGCYSQTPNDDENRLLKGEANYYTNNTPRICSETCFKKGYLYFGVTDGSECWCGNQQPSKSLKVDQKNCNSPCHGDKRQLCGGKWKMGIYSTGITDYEPKKYIGCFTDEKKTKGKYLSYQMENNNSPKRCMNLCNTQQFKYAAVKGNVCECKSYEPDYNLIKSQSDCNTLCTEDPSEYCGGGTALQNVYRTIYSDLRGIVAMYNIGCFKNSKRHPILSGWKITVPRLTPQYCVQSCYARRFPYAALMSSKECLCSFKKPFAGAKTENNMCSISCSGESGLNCGGINAMNIYGTGLEWKTDAIGNYYLGCFEENDNNRIFTSFWMSFILVNTPEYCSNLCYKNGYTYSGVTYMTECYCGNQLPDENLNRKLEDKQCNTKCKGDANQFCGGAWRMGVFATGLLTDLNSDYQYLGCFRQDNAFRKRKFELPRTNSPSICSAICNDAAYSFAEVIDTNCLCSNDAPNKNRKLDESGCNRICVGDSSATCGGTDNIQIYHLKSQDSVANSGDISYNSEQPNLFLSSTSSEKTIYTPEPSIYRPEVPLNMKIPQLQFNANTNKSQSVMYTGEYAFLNINSFWSHEIYIPRHPDFEFVFYNNSENNAYVENRELIIKPTIIPNSEFIKKGSLKLNGCTKKENTDECNHIAQSFNIIPPIMSAKLTTKSNILFRYGEIELVAKLPKGDWIMTEIALVSTNNEKDKIVLLSKGNENLKCNGADESAHILKHGLLVDEKYQINSNLTSLNAKFSSKSWADDYHSFKFSWSSGSLIFSVDEYNHIFSSPQLLHVLFNSKNYLSIGVSVGGMKNFPDECVSNGNLKPWRNYNIKAMLNFWRDMKNWGPTWNDETSTLRIKSLKFTNLS